MRLGKAGEITFTEASFWTITWPDGTAARIKPEGAFFDVVFQPGSSAGKLVGLLGNGDGNPTGDLVSRNGVALGTDFDRVLIVVLENQSYVAAIKDKYLKQLADEWVEFTNLRAVGHPSYPNYLAMISGSTFGLHGWFGDSQQNFPDDDQHKTDCGRD